MIYEIYLFIFKCFATCKNTNYKFLQNKSVASNFYKFFLYIDNYITVYITISFFIKVKILIINTNFWITNTEIVLDCSVSRIS